MNTEQLYGAVTRGLLCAPFGLIALPRVLQTTIFVDPAPPGALQNAIFVDQAPPGALQNTILADPATPRTLHDDCLSIQRLLEPSRTLFLQIWRDPEPSRLSLLSIQRLLKPSRTLVFLIRRLPEPCRTISLSIPRLQKRFSAVAWSIRLRSEPSGTISVDPPLPRTPKTIALALFGLAVPSRPRALSVNSPASEHSRAADEGFYSRSETLASWRLHAAPIRLYL